MTPILPVADLRSDTITRPTKAMKAAMMEAPLGDDVLGDDPTVHALQEKVAALLGKEAALFVPSGTMANQICVRLHTQPGEEIIIEAKAHLFHHETGGLGGISGVQAQLVAGNRGLLKPEDVEAAIRGTDAHLPCTAMIAIENTHNYGGGTVYPLDLVKRVREVADRHSLPLHMDGARLWNACVASGRKPSEYAKLCDSVSVCLSKGLGAPAGSMVAGTKAFVARALRVRKMLGGAMRQSGLLAAAGIYALDHHYDRLKEDHENAKHMASELAKIPGVVINPDEVETNLLYFGAKGTTSVELERKLRDRGVWLFAERPTQVRAVTHLDVTREQIDNALQVIREVLK